MAAHDSGKIYVFDKMGVRHPEDEFDANASFNDAHINNSDPPLIAVQIGTTIYVYKEGVEIFNTGPISSNLRGFQIGTSYLVNIIGGTLPVSTGYVQFRSIIDGEVLNTVSWAIDDRGSWFKGPTCTEDGATCFVQYQDTGGTGMMHTVKVQRSGIIWNQTNIQSGGIPSYLRCSSDGDIILTREHGGGWSDLRVLNGSKTTLDLYRAFANRHFAIGAEPDGAFGAWAIRGTTTARIVESDASTHNITLPSAMASVLRGIECFYGGYTGFLCVDGKIHFYDLDGTRVGAFDTEMYIHEIQGTTESASESLIRLLHKYPRPMLRVKSRLAYEVSP